MYQISKEIMNSGTLNAIKTCVSGSQYIEPARPKRFIHGDKIIRPYNHQESTGYKYLRDTENGFYLNAGSYVGHARLSDKAVLLITDKRIPLSNKNSVLGSWSTEWEMLHAEIDYPKQTDNCSIEC
uniref:Restriction endonuclease subunit S n=1 Tax=Rhabditophanes sp. KR3021 TaxID=114890 RepID=A0AC35TYL7_9BILA